VVFDHLTYSVFQPVRDSVYHWFDPGQYGVFVFFLVSGYWPGSGWSVTRCTCCTRC